VIALGYVLALFIGISLGLLGGGGSILTVPVLHYILGYDVKSAVPMSLVVVGLTSAVGALTHWKAGTLHVRTALSFGPPAVLGAFLGAELGLKASPRLQLAVLAVVMVLAALTMFFGSVVMTATTATTATIPITGGRLPLVPLVGGAVGLLTGFAGVGGGFLYVPALVVLGGLPMRKAVGTSLALILLSCIAGVTRYHGSQPIDWRAVALFTAIALVGVLLGSRLVSHVSQTLLRKAFAALLLLMGGLVLTLGR